MACIIRFRRPGAPTSVSSLFVENEETEATQIRHLEAIGYVVMDGRPETEMRPSLDKSGNGPSLQRHFGLHNT
jgi:hypothetical protein